MANITTADGETSSGMAYYKNPTLATDLAIPITKSPVRFSVMRRNGLSSNAWRVWVDEGGEAYIRSRDHMHNIKVSLHRSGQHQLSFTTESRLEMTEGNRHWIRWSEPPNNPGSPVIPTFNLYFPSWGLTLNEDRRNTHPRVWDRNQIAIEAGETPTATVISFVIMNDQLNIPFNISGDIPHFPLAALPLRLGKKLWVVACHRPEANMRDLARQGASGLAGYAQSTPEPFTDIPDGEVLGMCVAGNTPAGGTFLMPFEIDAYQGQKPVGRDSNDQLH